MAGKFEPKTAVALDPPKDDPITVEELAAADGKPPPRGDSACLPASLPWMVPTKFCR
jgi:hypothetical protein